VIYYPSLYSWNSHRFWIWSIWSHSFCWPENRSSR